MRCLDGITNPIDISLIKLWGIVKDREARHCCSPWGRKESDTTKGLNDTYLPTYLFWLFQVLVVAHGILHFHCSMWDL